MTHPAKEKVAIFVCDDLTGILILNRIMPDMKTMGYEPVIFNTGSNRNRQFKIPTPPMVSFFNAALPTQVIIPTLEAQSATAAPNYTYRQLVALHDLEYREIKNVNDPAFVNEIAADPEYRGAIAARFLQVFEKEAISVFHEKGFLWNLHSGLLPNYKGLLTPFRAIANGEKTYGLTLHDLTCGLDEGDIILQGELPLNPAKPVLDLYLDSVPTGADMILKSLAAFKRDGAVPLASQGQTPAKSYYTNPTEKEFRDFAAQGIVYAKPVEVIERITHLFTAEGTILRETLREKLQAALCAALTPSPAIPPRRMATLAGMAQPAP